MTVLLYFTQWFLCFNFWHLAICCRLSWFLSVFERTLNCKAAASIRVLEYSNSIRVLEYSSSVLMLRYSKLSISGTISTSSCVRFSWSN